MDIAQRINPDADNFHLLLAARGLTVEQVNQNDGDPYNTMNLIRRSIAYAQSLIPRIYRNAIADIPEGTKWINDVANHAIAEHERRGTVAPAVINGPSLLLLGPTGVGKTYQAYGILRALAVAGVSAPWIATSSADLYAALRPRAGVDSETEFRRYAHARLLLVDDLGAAKSSEWTEEINFRLVNHRYENQLPTLLTSNVLPKQLADRLGDRVASRLTEMCERTVITGQDRRRKDAS